jgi:putative transcriptional regulator
MSITHHLSEATMMSFAAGSLPQALAGVAAAHAALCPDCRREIAAFEQVGAALLEGIAPVPMTLGEPPLPEPASEQKRPQPPPVSTHVPAPLARLMGERLSAINWRWLGPGIWHSRLALTGSGSLFLLKLAPGRRLPAHGHTGSELTLVLSGAFRDETGHYAHGDVADLDEEIGHQPVADPRSGCICAVACERPVQFRGLLPRLLRPLHGY